MPCQLSFLFCIEGASVEYLCSKLVPGTPLKSSLKCLLAGRVASGTPTMIRFFFETQTIYSVLSSIFNWFRNVAQLESIVDVCCVGGRDIDNCSGACSQRALLASDTGKNPFWGKTVLFWYLGQCCVAST